MHKYANLGDTVCFWFGANTTAGSGGDGASAAARVRLAGAAANAAPVLSPTPTLLSHANYPDGCYEVAVAATVGNGFAAGNEYAVFCTLAIDSQNPTGFLGSFTLDLQDVNAKEVSDSSAAADAVEANIANLNAQVTSRSSHSAADVWSVGARTLTSFGSLASDCASAVWVRLRERFRALAPLPPMWRPPSGGHRRGRFPALVLSSQRWWPLSSPRPA